MKERIKSLNRFQQCVFLLMLLASLGFLVLYFITLMKEGILYKDAILVPNRQEGTVVYSGEVQRKKVSFTVSEDNTVVYQCGEKTYGPYRVMEDPSALPARVDNWESVPEDMMGLEVYKEEMLLFRGGLSVYDDYLWLVNQDGSHYADSQLFLEFQGEVYDEEGNPVDTEEPGLTAIVRLLYNPVLTHKGNWIAWLGGVLICILNGCSILYADELFRWNLSFRIRAVEDAEPSDWEITQRYLSWGLMTIAAVAVFIMGLQ
ncbi:MAG: hypothetical protein Q4B85_10090 [Lachnospiraceae bacterium]|nr:hypothetical protein [Lachnospiraceae bacterium]